MLCTMSSPTDLILTSTRNAVTTLKMNNPARLNGWTAPMMERLKAELARAQRDDACKALILTGTDPYYCAGVNLGGTLKLTHPRKLHRLIVNHNQALFEAFLRFEKPMLVAINGPAIGASVTSATLADGIIASEKGTFSTPFSALAIVPEGCSSVHLERLIGRDSAARMLGPEGWKPTGAEAAEVGLAQWVAPHEQLMERAQAIAEGWAEAGKQREFRGGSTLDELLEINARESIELADSFLRRPFLQGQFRFLLSKKKLPPALTFGALWLTQPLWSRLLPRR
ncbi:MAG: crotonase [Proteobacteria bacterium]|nr:MAG: crotonase [Pseudomonadota bacterium]